MYKSVVLKEFKNYDSFEIQTNSLDDLRKKLDNEHVIIKVHGSPINPLDMMKLEGQVASIKTPFIPGTEGSGVIKEAHDQSLIDRNVSFMSQHGTWSEYSLAKIKDVILLDKETDLDSASGGFIVPVTSYGLVSLAIKYGAKGIINLAAASTVGRMVNALAKEKGLNCINVIKGDNNKLKQLQQDYNNPHVLSLDEDPKVYQESLKELAEKLQATVALDAIGGIVTGQTFNSMPPNSVVINYGTLSGEDIQGVDTIQLRWGYKRIEGFVFFSWFDSLSTEEQKETREFIQSKINSIFRTQVHKEFSFEDMKSALNELKLVEGGKKVIIRPKI